MDLHPSVSGSSNAVRRRARVASGIAGVVALANICARQAELVSSIVRRQGGYPVSYERFEDLELALEKGATFDLMLVSPDGGTGAPAKDPSTTWLSASRRIPTLFMMHPEYAASCDAATIDRGDFIMMPCCPTELAVRIARLKRRGSRPAIQVGDLEPEHEGYRFQKGRWLVAFGGKQVRLQPQEFHLALHLFRNIGSTQSRAELYEEIWGTTSLHAKSRSLDVHIASIRKKLELGLNGNCDLLSIRKIGYLMTARSPGDQETTAAPGHGPDAHRHFQRITATPTISSVWRLAAG